MSKHEIYPPLSPMWTPSPVQLSTWEKNSLHIGFTHFVNSLRIFLKKPK